MILPAACVLYTQDSDFVRRARAYLRNQIEVRHVNNASRLDPVLRQQQPAVLLLDLRGRESQGLIEQVQVEWPEVLIIALGTPRSEPLREAENAGVYAAEDVNLERQRIQALVGRALDHLRLLEENRLLRAATPRAALVASSRDLESVRALAEPALPMLRLPRLFQPRETTEMTIHDMVEGLAEGDRVTRDRIFSRGRAGEGYRLRAVLRCLPESYELEYRERDPLVRWFELHAHLVCRHHLPQTQDYAQRELLRRALDTVGAEVIVPLHSRGQISGWLFFCYLLTS